MDEFIYVLIAVVVIFALLFAFSTPLSEIMTNEGSGVQNEIDIAAFPGGSVGMQGDNVTKVINFGTFDLGRSQRYDILHYPEMNIKAGLLDSKSEKFAVDTDIQEIKSSMKGLKVAFDLKKTNQLGNLVVRWNGYDIFNDIANLNHYDIDIPSERIMKDNYIEISCAGPGWMFWSENYYNLADFYVYAEYGPERIVPFTLTTDDLEAWDHGKVTFFTTGDDDTSLLIKLNGDVVYTGNKIGEKTEFNIGYSDANMKPGTNLMSFKAENGLITLHNTKMDIATFGLGGATLEYNLNISQDKYAYLSRYGAYLDINIKTVDKSGTLSVGVNGKRMNIQVSSAGNVSMFVDSSKFILGDNIIRFSGNGAWEIEDIKIYTKR